MIGFLQVSVIKKKRKKDHDGQVQRQRIHKHSGHRIERRDKTQYWSMCSMSCLFLSQVPKLMCKRLECGSWLSLDRSMTQEKIVQTLE